MRELAAQERTSVQDILARAVEQYRRTRLLEDANRTWTALREDSAAWQDVMDEQSLLDGTLLDGLDDE